ncbi:hypothetical protein [Granulicella mallensis]|uniref:Uncharacterized protein n=1 Tax=Granulicella mallensis TaxID=940614 RepID=A0A7W7ZUX8_9BACT|nr:hypothetical protein [Granulicella mallensis]MBB5066179.1 hypothetical protein [Granulicella mallensis]
MSKISTSIILLLICISGYGQTPQTSIQQKSTNSSCAAINAGRDVYCVSQKPPETMSSLRKKTAALATQILAFSYAREGQPGDVDNQALAQGILVSINRNPASGQAFISNVNHWNAETRDMFLKDYWPQVTALTGELAAAGFDVTPVSRGAAANDPRTIGLMLSVVSARIGKKPPYSRTLTKDEANAILRGLGKGANIEIYAKKDDPNSLLIAGTLAAEANHLGLLHDITVRPLEDKQPALTGIQLVVPSADLEFNFQSVYLTLKECELETTITTRETKPYRVFLAIEVWPATQAEIPQDGMPSMIVNTGPQVTSQ